MLRFLFFILSQKSIYKKDITFLIVFCILKDNYTSKCNVPKLNSLIFSVLPILLIYYFSSQLYNILKIKP